MRDDDGEQYYARSGQYGVFRTRKSDFPCPRVETCGHRCLAGRGLHSGPHLFEEHDHVSRSEHATLLDHHYRDVLDAARSERLVETARRIMDHQDG